MEVFNMFVRKIILSFMEFVILSIVYNFLMTSHIFAQGRLLKDDLCAQDASISCAAAEEIIHYTTDGSKPTKSDLIFSSPVNINSTTTSGARAYESGWSVSSVTGGYYRITHANSAKASLEYLADVMDQYHKRFIVYEDAGSAGNHFHAFAKIPDESAAVEINGSYSEKPHSGATEIRCEFKNTTGTNFGGFYFQNGILPPDSLAPTPNFGETPNSGIDLSGVDSLIFWARGKQGGEKIEFFAAGVGRNAVTGIQIAPYPGSSPRHPELGTIYTLETEWKKFTIDLAGLDLNYVLGGFAWVANSLNNPNGAVFYLDDIYYELNSDYQAQRLNVPRFLRSFTTLPVQPDPNDGNLDDDLDLVLRNAAFTYDNALSLIAFLADSLDDDSMRRAMLIGDAFLYAASNDRSYDDGRLRDAYAAGDISLPPGWTPKGQSRTVPVPGYFDESKQRFFEVEATGISTGNNAWAMIALLALHKRTAEQKYLDAARKIGVFIQMFRNESGLYEGFQGGVDDAETETPVSRKWASTEHNLDIYAAFIVMHEITGESQWRTDAEHALQFLAAMWDTQRGCYLTGTVDPYSRNMNPGQLPLDTQSWSILALPDTVTFKSHLLDCARQNHRTMHHGFHGFDFNEDKDGVWFEGLAQMAVAYAFVNDDAAKSLREELRKAQQTNPFGDGRGIAAACHDGVSTGFGFKVFRRLHVGATSWNVFAQLKFNPFYQGLIPPGKPTTIQSAGGIPTGFRLSPGYPNPFNPTMTVEYELPGARHVTVRIFNLTGQEIRTLVDEMKPPGIHKIEWDGLDHRAQEVSTGLYVVRMIAGDFVDSKKIMHLR